MTLGALLFARYAYPPNALGYCGADDARTLLEYGDASASDGGLVQLARSFEGAWPYLELIAHANGIEDPLDPQAVEAYWIGSRLLEQVDPGRLVQQLDDRFRMRAGRAWTQLTETLPKHVPPHHNFHVFGVYPWVGLLQAGNVAEPLRVLDSCRITSGRVHSVSDGVADVLVQPLVWDGRTLGLGPPVPRRAEWRREGLGFVRDLVPGDWVALHWDWVCDRLSFRQKEALAYYTSRTLALANRGAAPATLSG
ncbi:MAG TPA: DUF6390 family protein [Gaiellaceae bacterium]|nr:DUF6390 family protein [Gaiellaceae bacterium]